jgi:hypothetical protein
MNLADLRRITVKKQLRIRFTLSNGMECVLNEHGIAQVPALRSVPAFNLEDELAAVQQFLVEPVVVGSKDKGKSTPRNYTRTELSAMAAAGTGGESAHDDHDE